MGREYPLGFEYFRVRLKEAFLKNKDITDVVTVSNLIARGEFVEREIKALYMLKKYRTLKKRYYETEEQDKLQEFEKKFINK